MARGLRLTEEQYKGVLRKREDSRTNNSTTQTPKDKSSRVGVAHGSISSRSKYRNVPVVVDGLRFDSKREAARWRELKLLEHSGKIFQLFRQVPFKIFVNKVPICTYVADFVYLDGDRQVVEDVKSKPSKTPVYRLKKKLMWAVHGIKIAEV